MSDGDDQDTAGRDRTHNRPRGLLCAGRDLGLLWRAYELVERAHAGQTRATGEPYVTHVVSVAGILADLCMEPETIAAALLHDVVEDTDTTLEEPRARNSGQWMIESVLLL